MTATTNLAIGAIVIGSVALILSIVAILPQRNAKENPTSLGRNSGAS